MPVRSEPAMGWEPMKLPCFALRDKLTLMLPTSVTRAPVLAKALFADQRDNRFDRRADYDKVAGLAGCACLIEHSIAPIRLHRL